MKFQQQQKEDIGVTFYLPFFLTPEENIIFLSLAYCAYLHFIIHFEFHRTLPTLLGVQRTSALGIHAAGLAQLEKYEKEEEGKKEVYKKTFDKMKELEVSFTSFVASINSRLSITTKKGFSQYFGVGQSSGSILNTRIDPDHGPRPKY